MENLNWQQHVITVYMLLLTLHEWEETRFPGGFYEMMPACLGCVEALSHTAGIFIFHRKVPYTPGMYTASLLFVIILFVFFMQLALRQIGFSMSELIKRIK